MSDTPFAIVERAHRRTAQIRSGDVPAALQVGPKWVCQIIPREMTEGSAVPLSPEHAASMLAHLRPANVPLTRVAAHADGWLASAATDVAGKCRAYACINDARAIEMVGMPGVGPWANERDTWWPGVYELPLLEQVSATDLPLSDLLVANGSTYVLMSLTEIDGTALVTESDDGIERPFRIPAGVDTIHFPAVCVVKPATHWREAFIVAFARIRQLVGLKTARPFYL